MTRRHFDHDLFGQICGAGILVSSATLLIYGVARLII